MRNPIDREKRRLRKTLTFSMGGSTDWLASAKTNYVTLNADVALGAVDGGRVIGDTPDYSDTDKPDDAGEDDGSFAGRLIPKISVNQYAATLSRWMGVSESELNGALPDLQNFAETDLGFMQS